MTDGHGITLVVSVWGEWHTSAFLQLNLPSLLAPKNLPALAQIHAVSLVIFTTDRDRMQIETSPLFRRLGELMHVSFERIADQEIRDPIMTQQSIWWKAIAHVEKRRTYLFFLPPDVVWSNMSMENIGRAIATGCEVVIIPWTIRVVAETFRPAMLSFYEDKGAANGISSRDLVRLTLEHLHPLIAAYDRDSPFFSRHPEMLIAPIAKQGLLLRLLASIPTLFRPCEMTLNENKLVIDHLPDEKIYIPQDSDEVFVASLASLGKDFTFFDRPRRADPASIGRWWLGYPSGTNDALIRANYRIHYAPLEHVSWQPMERTFDQFLRRCVIAREGLEVWHVLRKRYDCAIAIEALAAAIHTGALARAVRGKGSRVLVVPTDKAFEHWPPDQLDHLLSFEGRGEFIRLLRSLMAAIRTQDERDVLTTKAGAAVLVADNGDKLAICRDAAGRLEVNGVAAVGDVVACGDHHAIIVDALSRS